MLRSEMVEEVRNRLGEDTEDYWKNTQIIRALNEAVAKFSHEEAWPWLQSVDSSFSLALNASTIVLPNDIDLVKSFNVFMQQGTQTPYMAKRVSPAEGLVLSISRQNAGKPRFFYLNTTAQSAGALQYTVKFVPKADATYSITFHYLRRPVTLSADGTEPDMPEDYQWAVIAYATATLWLTELQGSTAKASEQMELYASILASARADMNRLASDETLVYGGKPDEGEWGAPLPVLPDTYGERYGWGQW
jgi:hypothetical protein